METAEPKKVGHQQTHSVFIFLVAVNSERNEKNQRLISHSRKSDTLLSSHAQPSGKARTNKSVVRQQGNIKANGGEVSGCRYPGILLKTESLGSWEKSCEYLGRKSTEASKHGLRQGTRDDNTCVAEEQAFDELRSPRE